MSIWVRRRVADILHSFGVSIPVSKRFFCDGCALGKLHRQSYMPRLTRARKIGEIIHSDVCGPMPLPGGSKYFVLFKDDYRHCRKIYFVHGKRQVANCLKVFLEKTKIRNHVVQVLQSDNGGKFDNQTVREILPKEGIEQRLIAPYAHEQASCVERDNRSINDLATTMLQASKAP